MYDRLTDKSISPTNDQIISHVGEKSWNRIIYLFDRLATVFSLKTELKFPFGNTYGWGYKVSHKTKHLFYLFFEKNCFTITFQIPDNELDKNSELYNTLSDEGKQYWKNRYPCGTKGGGWIHYRVTKENQLQDIGLFLKLRTKKSIPL
jgi:hypothetical protein